MLVYLPTTPLAKRCVVFEYGVEPIAVKARSSLFRNLSKRTFSRNTKKASEECTELLVLNVTRKLASHIEKENTMMLGYLLHGHYMHQMSLAIIDNTTLAPENIMTFIKKYFAVRNISEDDYALDSAYKSWQRFQDDFLQKKEVFSSQKLTINVQEMRTINYIFSYNALLRFFDLKPQDLFHHRLKSPKLVYNRKIMLFLLKRLTPVKNKQLEKDFKIDRRSIYKSVTGTSFLYDNNIEDQLVEDINKAFVGIFNNSPLDAEIFQRLLKHDD